ncbi:MAG TPA: hypothetical protein VEL74_22160 [Thermoanaerobaculia bacterium]|nr:hypothetical protein [Thermoanaerobaculia bacterium]
MNARQLLLALLAVPAVLTVLATGCRTAGVPAPEGAPPGMETTAPALLATREPEVAWRTKSLVKADLDGDGKEDYALGGVKGDRYVLGIVQGPPGSGSRHWTLDFGVAEEDQESLCSLQAQLAVEDLDRKGSEGEMAANAKGLRLHDDRCDAFHIFWNTREKRYEWWRL